MLAWIFASFWHALVGLVLLTVFFLGAVGVLARAVAESARHDQATCDCIGCRRRREVAARKRWGNANGKPPAARLAANDHWISTIQLIGEGAGTVVEAKGTSYQYREMAPGDGCWVLRMKNLRTRQSVVTTVNYEAGHRKIWKLGR